MSFDCAGEWERAKSTNTRIKVHSNPRTAWVTATLQWPATTVQWGDHLAAGSVADGIFTWLSLNYINLEKFLKEVPAQNPQNDTCTERAPNWETF